MVFSKHILIDEQIKTKKHPKIKAAILKGNPLKGYLYIVRIQGGNGLLEFLSPKELSRLVLRHKVFVIVAVMKDEEAALSFMVTLADRLVRRYGDVTKEAIDKEYDIQWL